MVERIDTLTPEQVQTCLKVRDYWIDLILGGDDSVDIEGLRSFYTWAYAQAKLDAPEVIICDSPRAAVEYVRSHGQPDCTGLSWWGANFWCWLAAWGDCFVQLGLDDLAEGTEARDRLDRVISYLRAGVYDVYVGKFAAVVARRPTVCKLEWTERPADGPFGSAATRRGRLHCEDGPALQWRDGFSVWAHHGVIVSQQVIESPETLTIKQIDEEQNVEVRRVMIERFTAERYLRESGTNPIATDAFGKLYIRERQGDDPLAMVEVLNSTPEPDGSTRTYWIRVPPTMKTPREAVAWTFDMQPDEYAPEIET